MPEMRTRTKMKNVASDRARRENVLRHILSYVYGEPSADWCLHKVLHLVKGRCYRSTGTEKKLVILVLVASKNNSILFDVL